MALAARSGDSGRQGDTPPSGGFQAQTGTEDRQQYVSFTIDRECFAFPMAKVREIIRVPATVGVPLTSPSLVGLANLRGSVIPVLSLRALLAMRDAEVTDASRVLVIDHGRLVGLVVDRVTSVMTVDQADIEPADNVQTTLDTRALAGAVKNHQGWELVLLLDPARILEAEYGAATASRAGASSSGPAQGGGAVEALTGQADGGAGRAEESCQLVSFMVDDQEYAFPIARVEEIVRVPDQISQVPNADRRVFGLINLRQRLLPLLGLRRLFALPDAELDEESRVVVLRLSATETVGIVVDRVREVLRVPRGDLDEVPPILSQGAGTDLSAVCRMDQGTRLVSILSVEAMFDHPAVREGLTMKQTADAADAASASTADPAAGSGSGAGSADADIQLVVLRLDGEEFGVGINAVQEIIRLPDQFSKVPKTAAFIDGMVNLRGAVLPVVDLRSRLGFPRKATRDDRQRIMVLTLGGTLTGFVVDSVTEVLRLSASEIEPAPAMSAEQSRMMGQVANLRRQGRMILLIDPNCLLDKTQVNHVRALADDLPQGAGQDHGLAAEDTAAGVGVGAGDDPVAPQADPHR